MLFLRWTPKINTDKSIAELSNIDIGGISLWLQIRGTNKNNPIILFLHGGPGTAQIGFARKYQNELEKHFVVVNWDQRGAGLSYSSKIDSKTMNINQFISDTKEVVNYLLTHFKKEKLFLIGDSWGSLLGTKVVNKYPDLFHAYIGTGQVVNMKRNEQLAYKYTLEEAKERNDEKAIQKLEEIGLPPYDDLINSTIIRSKLTRKLGGTMYKDSLFNLFIKKMVLSTEYNIIDIYRFIKGNQFSMINIWEEIMEVNFFKEVTSFKIPIYFVLGKHDFTAPSEIAEEYYSYIDAPSKKLIWIENAAHVMQFENSRKFQEIIINKVLNS